MAKNKSVKNANIEEEYTPENLMEISKCLDDPIYFIENYVKVKKDTPFKMFDYSKDMINFMHDNRYTIIMASRQLGKCVHKDTEVYVLKNKYKFLRRILERLLK